MFDIKDKIVLITGGAIGIGASIVNKLLEENVKHITILDVDEKNGIAVQEKLNTKYGNNKVKFIRCDVTKEDELVNAFETLKSEQGYIDVVINNAGILNDKAFEREIEINLTAVVRSTLQAWDIMRKDNRGRGGTVINISSVAAFSTFPGFSIYAATKTAILKFSSTLGDKVHYSRTGIRILTICFGVTETTLLANISSFDQSIEKSMTETIQDFQYQTVEQAAEGFAEVYKKGTTASVWIVTHGKPAVDVTERYVKSTEMFDDIVYDLIE